MKKTLLLTTLSFSLIGNSQSLTQANEPVIGETASMYLCDSFTVTNAAVTGPAVTWDYTNLVGIFGETRDVDVINPTSSANAADFPSSSKAIAVESSMTSFFSSSAAERVSEGFIFNEVALGHVIAKFDGDSERLMTYPFVYGNSQTDNFSGSVNYVLGFPQSSALTGTVYSEIDGQGTLNLPLGVSLPNVIRYKIVDSSYTTVIGIGDLEILRHQYEYYDITNSNLPVLSISRLIIQIVGSGSPISDFSLVLSAYPTSEFLSINEEDQFDFNVYPNPASNNITINGEFTSDATGQIIDQAGRVISTFNVSNNNSVDISALEMGSYFVKITDNNSSVTKTIVKK